MVIDTDEEEIIPEGALILSGGAFGGTSVKAGEKFYQLQDESGVYWVYDPARSITLHDATLVFSSADESAVKAYIAEHFEG